MSGSAVDSRPTKRKKECLRGNGNGWPRRPVTRVHAQLRRTSKRGVVLKTAHDAYHHAARARTSVASSSGHTDGHTRMHMGGGCDSWVRNQDVPVVCVVW